MASFVVCGMNGTLIEHLIPILTLLDSYVFSGLNY